MKELLNINNIETKNLMNDKYVIDPNKRIDIAKDYEINRNDELDPNKRIKIQIVENDKSNISETEQKQELLFTDYDDRIKATRKDTERGYWTGKRGESKYIPTDIPKNKNLIELLESKGVDGIEYKNGCVDFAKVAELSIKIPDMTDIRYKAQPNGKPGNFGQALIAVAEKWNSVEKDGRTNWTYLDVQKWSRANKLVIHERYDLTTCDFIKKEIHSFFKHSGGVAEYNAKLYINNNGGFDE